MNGDEPVYRMFTIERHYGQMPQLASPRGISSHPR